MTAFNAGDVLRHTRLNGVTDYIRIGGPNPDGSPSIFVMTCNPRGGDLTNGRYLLAETIATRYQPFAQPKETYRA